MEKNLDKQIVLKIGINMKKDEFATIINVQGFKEGKEIQNIAEIIGWLEVVKHQELKKSSKLVSSN